MFIKPVNRSLLGAIHKWRHASKVGCVWFFESAYECKITWMAPYLMENYFSYLFDSGNKTGYLWCQSQVT